MSSNKKTVGIIIAIVIVVLAGLAVIGKYGEEIFSRTTQPAVSVPTIITPASTDPPPTTTTLPANTQADEPYYGTFSNRTYTNKWAGFAFVLPDGFTGSMENKNFVAESISAIIGVYFPEDIDPDVFKLDDAAFFDAFTQGLENDDVTVLSSTVETVVVAETPFHSLLTYNRNGTFVRYLYRQIENRMCQIVVAASTESTINQLLTHVVPY